MKTPKPGDRIDLSSDSKPVDQPNAAHPGEGKPPEPKRAGDTMPQKPRFNLEALRLSQNFAETAGVEKRGAIRLGKPPKHSFIRVHAGLTFPTRLLEFGESKDTYLVAAELCDSLASLLRLVVLRVYVTLDGVVGVCEVNQQYALTEFCKRVREVKR